MKLQTQRASRRQRKAWIRSQRPARRALIGTALHKHLEAFVAETPCWTVMVKLNTKPRAQRIAADGTLTTRRDRARPFNSKADAEKLAREQVKHDSAVERAWVAPF